MLSKQLMRMLFVLYIIFILMFPIQASIAHPPTESDRASIDCKNARTLDCIQIINLFQQNTLNTNREPDQSQRIQLASQQLAELEPYRECVREEPNPHSRLELAQSLLKKLNAYTRYIYLEEIARFALETSENDLATKYSMELLKLANIYSNDPNHGNAIHQANIVLGHISINEGALNKAKQYLLQAGMITGSVQLARTGPDVTLAKKLAAMGEIEVVIQYLELCKNFWEHDNGRIDQWISSLKSDHVLM